MWKLKLFIFSTLPFWCGAVEATRGRIAKWEGSTRTLEEVNLPDFSQGFLKNDLLSFSSLPKDLLPGSNDCLCFDAGEERFAYIQAYYYATNQLLHFNESLRKLNLPPLRTLEIGLQIVEPGFASHGEGEKNGAYLWYQNPAFDPSLLAHEIGHAIHLQLQERAKEKIEGDKISSIEILESESAGVREGAANMLAAFFLGQTAIGKHDYFEGAYEIDRFIRLPDQIVTIREHYLNLLGSEQFSHAYPNSMAEIREALKKEPQSKFLDFPHPYITSAVINQPLWAAGKKFGFSSVEAIYLATFSTFRSNTYSELANAILRKSSVMHQAEMHDFLRAEFLLRGLNIY